MSPSREQLVDFVGAHRQTETSPRKTDAPAAASSLPDGPPRHDRLRGKIMRWRSLLPIEETRELAFALACTWGMEPDRDDEVERLVVGAYDKPASRITTEYERDQDANEVANVWQPLDLVACASPDAGKVDFLAEDLLVRGETHVLAAEWKTAKTLIVYRASVDLAEGLPVFGQFRVDGPKRVMIFQLEMPRTEDERRFRRLAIGCGIDPVILADRVKEERLLVFNRPPLWLADKRGRAILHQLVERYDPDVVVIDSLLAAASGTDLNDNPAVRELFTHALGPLTSRGVTVILLHHRRKAAPGRKSDDPRGSILGAQAIGAAAGRVLSLERIEGGEDGRFLLRLALVGAWAPGGNTDAVLEVADTRDGGTVVRVMSVADQIKGGGVSVVQRAALVLAKLVRARGCIEKKAAMEEAAEDAGVKETSMKEAFKYAREQGWIESRPIEGAAHNRHELVPGPTDDLG